MADNAELAKKLLHSLESGQEFFRENMVDDIVLEFPYATSINLPARVEGREEASTYLAGVFDMVKGLHFRDVEAFPMADSDMILLTYKGLSTSPDRPAYDQTYITVMRFRQQRICLFREYWDTTIVTTALGNILAVSS